MAAADLALASHRTHVVLAGTSWIWSGQTFSAILGTESAADYPGLSEYDTLPELSIVYESALVTGTPSVNDEVQDSAGGRYRATDAPLTYPGWPLSVIRLVRAA